MNATETTYWQTRLASCSQITIATNYGTHGFNLDAHPALRQAIHDACEAKASAMKGET